MAKRKKKEPERWFPKIGEACQFRDADDDWRLGEISSVSVNPRGEGQTPEIIVMVSYGDRCFADRRLAELLPVVTGAPRG